MNRPSTKSPAGRSHALACVAAALACQLLAVVAQARPVETREVLATVQRVVDGDTIVIGKGRAAIHVRLRCIDTPEVAHRDRRAEPYGPEARTFTRQALSGQAVRLVYHVREPRDRYDRLLAYVFLKDGTFFNGELVRRGLAQLTRFQCLYRKQLKSLETEARAQRRGLWAKNSTTRQ